MKKLCLIAYFIFTFGLIFWLPHSGLHTGETLSKWQLFHVVFTTTIFPMVGISLGMSFASLLYAKLIKVNLPPRSILSLTVAITSCSLATELLMADIYRQIINFLEVDHLTEITSILLLNVVPAWVTFFAFRKIYLLSNAVRAANEQGS